MRIQDGWELMPVKTPKATVSHAPTIQNKSGRKTPITLTIAPELLRKVDAEAESRGMSRASYIAVVLSYATDRGIFK